MAVTNSSLRYFPYTPRPYQDRAVAFAAQVFSTKSVGLLSADCGVGKTIAALSGYLAARADDSESRLIVLTRTHSQARVFENELVTLRRLLPSLTATTMQSRVHTCPIREQVGSLSLTGFMRACANLIKTGSCTHYWAFYRKGDSRPQIRDRVQDEVDDLLDSGVITRELVDDRARDLGVCPYELMKHCARESHIVIGPYSYLFCNRVREATLSSLGTRLEKLDVIVDEAHNLPGHILESEAAKLSWDDLKWLRDHSAELARDSGAKWLVQSTNFLWETLAIALDGMNSRNEKVLDKWDVAPRFVDEDALRQVSAADTLLGDPDALSTVETPFDRLVEFLLAALRAAKSDDWHISVTTRKSSQGELTHTTSELVIRPLNSAGLAAPVLRGTRSVLLISGTLRPLEYYARQLGIAKPLSEDLASPYRRGTRLILVDKSVTTKYEARNDELWRRMAERIQTALLSLPANKSALIAFPSYAILHDVFSYGVDTGYRGTVVENPRERIETLVDAVLEGPKAIFCVYGGKFSEGVDLARDGSSLLEMIIGVGLPFTPPSSYLQAQRNWLDGRFGEGTGYFYGSVIPSVRQVLQLIGRLRRSPEDSGVVLLLDNRFLRYTSVLGEDMVSDIWPFADLEEMRLAISEFQKQREACAVAA
jgi:DNA excision repair protein ERCC-2